MFRSVLNCSMFCARLLLGHATLDHTTVYLHLSQRHLHAAPSHEFVEMRRSQFSLRRSR